MKREDPEIIFQKMENFDGPTAQAKPEEESEIGKKSLELTSQTVGVLKMRRPTQTKTKQNEWRREAGASGALTAEESEWLCTQAGRRTSLVKGEL